VAVNPNKRLPAGSVWVLFVDNVQVARTSMSKSTASVRVSKGLHRVKIRIETPTGVSAYSASRSLLAR
jgi:hypothetical protein